MQELFLKKQVVPRGCSALDSCQGAEAGRVPIVLREIMRLLDGRSRNVLIFQLRQGDDDSSQTPEWFHNTDDDESVSTNGMDQ